MGYKIDVQFVQPFIDGAIETFKVQCQVAAHIGGAPSLRKEGATDADVDIAGRIAIESDHFCGSITLCFPKKTFLGLVGKMLGESYQMITPEVEDGAGEMLNIIFGFAKRRFSEMGYPLPKAIPAIVRGSHLRTRHATGSPVIILPFQSECGGFQLEIGIDPAWSRNQTAGNSSHDQQVKMKEGA